jgi:hypothetical protein
VTGEPPVIMAIPKAGSNVGPHPPPPPRPPRPGCDLLSHRNCLWTCQAAEDGRLRKGTGIIVGQRFLDLAQ